MNKKDHWQRSWRGHILQMDSAQELANYLGLDSKGLTRLKSPIIGKRGLNYHDDPGRKAKITLSIRIEDIP